MKDKKIPGIGERIASLRRSRKMTQEALANKLDVSPKHISHVERDCASLSLYKLAEMSRILNCSLDYLVNGRYYDDLLNKIPENLVHILESDDKAEKERLIRYLEFYSELVDRHSKK